MVEHLMYIQGAWVQSPVWPLFRLQLSVRDKTLAEDTVCD